jgi:beta-galactosidase
MMKLKVMILLFLALCISGIALSQTQQSIPLDGQWNFAVDSTNTGFQTGWFNGIPTQLSKHVIVPHTWNIEDGTEDYAGWAWYEKEIEIRNEWKNNNIRIKFEAVYHDAIVYVNGVKVGENLNAGFTPFTLDITGSVLFDKKNKIVVAVNNAFSKTNFPYLKSFDWANDGGIIRPVHLEITGKPSFNYVHVTPQINLADSTGKTSIAIKLWETNVRKATISFVFKDKKTGAIKLTEIRTLNNTNGIFATTFDLGRISPWHFDTPNLYELETKISVKNNITDVRNSVFGFRKVELKGEQLFLNGEAVRLPGIEYTPASSPIYGIAEPHIFMDSVVRMMKDLNVCITRFHWQQDEYTLSLMDKYGILVQEELPWWQKPARLSPELIQSAQKQLNDVIESHYNHPSIFSWGISNEVNGDTDKKTYLDLKDFIKGHDATRFATVVSNRIWQKKEKDESLLYDMPTWNEYIGTWHGKDRNELKAKLDTVKMSIGNRPLLITENGLCEPANPGGDARRIDDMLFHIKEWKSRPFTIGYIYFCLSDYRTHMGEEGFGKFRIRRHGLTDMYLKPKPSYSVFKQLASPVEITKVERVNNTDALVEIKVKSDIPAYKLRSYRIQYKKNNNELVNLDLPVLSPGDTYAVELKQVNPTFAFEILRPDGYSVIKY